jgi:hypothetical protein
VGQSRRFRDVRVRSALPSIAAVAVAIRELTRLVGTQIESPADRPAAGRAEVVVQCASFRTVPGIVCRLTARPCAVTNLAVTNGNSIRLSLANDIKSAALATRTPRHDNSPVNWYRKPACGETVTGNLGSPD